MDCFHIIRFRLCTYLCHAAYMFSIVTISTAKDWISDNNIIGTFIHCNIPIPKEQLITSRYAKETAERKNHLQALQAECDKAEKDLLALKAEILAVIKGESAFPKDTLAEMIAAQEKKHTELETLCEEASAELERNAELMANVSQLYEELISYADLYDSASFEAKKMIVSQLIRRVDVYRGYQIHVDFNFDLAQYLENSDELAC